MQMDIKVCLGKGVCEVCVYGAKSHQCCLWASSLQHVTGTQLEFLCVLVSTPSLPPSPCTGAVRLLGQVARLAAPGTPPEGALQVGHVTTAHSQALLKHTAHCQ